MKKLLGILVLGLLWCNASLVDAVSGTYKRGKGPLKISKNTADLLEYYFSGGKMGRYAKTMVANSEAFLYEIDFKIKEYK